VLSCDNNPQNQEVVYGCVYDSACNYNPNATIDNPEERECIYPYECDLCDNCNLPNLHPMRLNDDGSLWYNFNHTIAGFQLDLVSNNIPFDLENYDIIYISDIANYTNINENRMRFIFLGIGEGNGFIGCQQLLQINYNISEHNLELSNITISFPDATGTSITPINCTSN
tara:strand:- start:69 stop:578 length:510 start_codon:yes stop_codon:yes gene_type:complete